MRSTPVAGFGLCELGTPHFPTAVVVDICAWCNMADEVEDMLAKLENDAKEYDKDFEIDRKFTIPELVIPNFSCASGMPG